MRQRPVLPFYKEVAKKIKVKLGASTQIKRDLIEMLLAHATIGEIFSAISSYLLLILSWNEMNNFNFCYDVLILHMSPILLDNRVIGESQNLFDAYKAIMKCSHPQFFRYLGTESEQMLLNKNSVTTLFITTTKIKSSSTQFSTISNHIQGGDPATNALADELTQLHRVAMNRRSTSMTININVDGSSLIRMRMMRVDRYLEKICSFELNLNLFLALNF